MVGKVEDQRQYPRVLVRVLVDFESSDTYLYDYTNNLSEGGIFIETEKTQPVGSPLTLRFTLPGIDRVFEAKGKVAWLNLPKKDGKRPSGDLAHGMGIQFDEIDNTDLGLIRKYVSEAQESK